MSRIKGGSEDLAAFEFADEKVLNLHEAISNASATHVDELQKLQPSTRQRALLNFIGYAGPEWYAYSRDKGAAITFDTVDPVLAYGILSVKNKI